jgi:hypothetical protein
MASFPLPRSSQGLCASSGRMSTWLGVHSMPTSSKPNAHRLEPNGFSLPSVLPAEKAVILGAQAVMAMIDLMQQLEVRAILAEKDREARAALRVSEARNGPRGLMAGYTGHLARPGIGSKRETPRMSPSGTWREPSVHDS